MGSWEVTRPSGFVNKWKIISSGRKHDCSCWKVHQSCQILKNSEDQIDNPTSKKEQMNIIIAVCLNHIMDVSQKWVTLRTGVFLQKSSICVWFCGPQIGISHDIYLGCWDVRHMNLPCRRLRLRIATNGSDDREVYPCSIPEVPFMSECWGVFLFPNVEWKRKRSRFSKMWLMLFE